MLARLLFDRVLSYPGSLRECNFTSNFGLGRLHCLSDCVLSLCKSVCSYLACLVSPCGGAPLAPVVNIHFLALSKPGQPHQMHPTTFSPAVSGTLPGASGGAGGNRTRVQHAPTSTFKDGSRHLIRPYSLRADESPSVFGSGGLAPGWLVRLYPAWKVAGANRKNHGKVRASLLYKLRWLLPLLQMCLREFLFRPYRREPPIDLFYQPS